MKRTEAEQEFHDRQIHADWMKRFERGIVSDPEPRWLTYAMLAILIGAVLYLAYVVAKAVL